jgi:hypothetical protein
MGNMMIYAIYTCITITGSLIKFVFTMFKFGHPDLRPHSPCEKSVKIPKGQSETVYQRRCYVDPPCEGYIVGHKIK